MKKITKSTHAVEVLESRIAPAALPLNVEWRSASHSLNGSPIELHAGQGLGTDGEGSGTYLLYVEKGSAWVFTTDFNNNSIVDFNEITGIAAGDGLRLVSFVDINGDIVTNLKEVTVGGNLVLSLTDSNNNASDDNPDLGGDGRVVLNNRIEKIEMRSLTIADIPDQDGNGIVNQKDVDYRRAPSTHSIFGNIYAGGGFGVAGDPTSGLIIDTTLKTNFGFEDDTVASVGSIRVGSAVSGEYFRFSINGGFDTSGGVLQKRVRAGLQYGDDAQGYLVSFLPAAGQVGASINYVRAAAADQSFNINGLYAGNGGPGAAGGSISDVTINGDDAGGYNIVAGNGGGGAKGGAGGSVVRFSDLGSDTSKVVIKSGDGGIGVTGAGGNAGNAEILNATFYGNFSIVLGDGGDGFTQGGNGASLSKGDFDQPIPVGYTGGTAWGTSHSPGYYNPDPGAIGVSQSYTPYIGTTQAIDIDGDGFGDYVYTTTDTSQLVVMFGDGLGNFRTVDSPSGLQVPDRMYLASPRNAEAMVVADLNGDGRPDIATGSSDVSNQAGISVFIAKWEDIDKNGRVDDPVDKFIGFYDPRYSPLPTLQDGDSQTLGFIGYANSPQQVLDIVAGDFDGDGANELAVMTTQYIATSAVRDPDTGLVTSVGGATPVIIFLTPDRELDTNTHQYFLTGHFYADFGTSEVDSNSNIPGADAPAVPIFPVIDVGGTPVIRTPGVDYAYFPATISIFATIDNVILDVTALSTGATHDTLIVGVQENKDFYSLDSVDFFDREPLFPGVIGAPDTLVGSWVLGQVDTNRDRFESAQRPNRNPTGIGLLDFAVLDLNQDGNADIIALSQQPGQFVVGIVGDGFGSGVQDSGRGSDQAGLYLGDNVDARGIKPADSDLDGIIDDFVVLEDLPGGFIVELYNWGPGPVIPGVSGPDFMGSPLGVIDEHIADYRTEQTVDGVFWDVYYPIANDQSSFEVGVNPTDSDVIWISGLGRNPRLAEPSLSIFAGDGGDSFAGKAGNGGFIGGKGSIETIIDPLLNTTTDYIGAVQIVFDGVVQLYAGNGGLGFSKGGNGGSVTGVSYRSAEDAQDLVYPAFLVAGNGGRAIAGTGGFGGDLIANSIEAGEIYNAGNGGDGKIGGRGGSVIGTNLKIGTNQVYDTFTDFVDVAAGKGGNGLKGGGVGGSIVNFSPKMRHYTDSGSERTGWLSYTAGDGGNAIGGAGGAGGSVVNSSPQLNAFLEKEIFIQAGNGGNGTKGGAGGNVTTFSLKQAGNTAAVALVGILAGHGGTGSNGLGGAGGSISKVSYTTLGNSFDGIFPLVEVGEVPPPLFTYSRLLAGNGGESFGSVGGAGGKITDSVVGVVDGTIAIVGGAGGSGLHQGGAGGALTNLKLTGLSDSTTAKGLFIAGAGGDARSYLPNPGEEETNPVSEQAKKAFGGRIGRGGVGGSISNIQVQGTESSHVDFIAGNGGSTIHYGDIYDTKTYVGNGGSIQNIAFNGKVGNTELAVAIKSYNDILNGETLKDYVERKIRIGEDVFETLSDANGNVGFVVGSAGRNKAVADEDAPLDFNSKPATGAKNGSLININVSMIMSAVAGSVDRIASIQLAQNVFTSGNVFGSDKGVEGVKEYIDETGNIDPAPAPDGRLIDGAFIISKVLNSPQIKPGEGRVFSI